MFHQDLSFETVFFSVYIMCLVPKKQNPKLKSMFLNINCNVAREYFIEVIA